MSTSQTPFLTRRWYSLIITMILASGFQSSGQGGDVLRFGEASQNGQWSYEEISHAPLNTLLQKYVDCKGMVCYRQWRENCSDTHQLEAYLQSLTQIDPALPSREEAKTAYYINAYNAMTLWGIMHEYPVTSIQRIDGKRTTFAIFDDLKFWDGNTFVSLNGIENDVLRPKGDPRIHFALVCAAKGCPRLRNQAYEAGSLHWQLDDNAREFFSDQSRFHVSELTNTVHMSPILDWYREDFGETDHQVVTTVFAYLPKQSQQWLSQHCDWKFRYLGYDWSLNDQCPTVSVKLSAIPYRTYSKFSPMVKSFKSMLPVSKPPSEVACDGCDIIAPQELLPMIQEPLPMIPTTTTSEVSRSLPAPF